MRRKRPTRPRNKSEVDRLSHETVDEFLARGGRIKKVEAAWVSRPASKPEKSPDKSTWGSWGAYGE